MREEDDVLTVEEVAEILRLGRNAIYEAVGRAEIPHRRIGKRIRFSRRAIAAWLDGEVSSRPWSLQGAMKG